MRGQLGRQQTGSTGIARPRLPAVGNGQTALTLVIETCDMYITPSLFSLLPSFPPSLPPPLSDSNARIGRYSWLVFTTIIVEGMLEIKFGWDIVSIPVPVTIKLAWATFFAAFALWTFWRFTLPFRDMPFIGKYLRRLEGRSKDE